MARCVSKRKAAAVERKVITPKGKTLFVPDEFTPEQELKAALDEDAMPSPVAPPKHDGFLGGISQTLESAARGIRNLPVPEANPTNLNARMGRAVLEGAKAFPAGLLDMAAHPIENAPMIGATLATLPLGPGAGVLRGMGRALAGNLAGQGVRSGAKAASGEGYPTAAGVPRGILEAGRDVITEGVARVFPMLRRAAVKDESRALAAYVDPKDLLTRRTAQGELLPTLPGPGDTRTVTPALEDLAVQSLDEVPGIRAMGRKGTASNLEALLSSMRARKTGALDTVASHEIPERRGKQRLAEQMATVAQRGSSPRVQLQTIRKTANNFFDRPVLERNAEGALELGADGLPLPVTIDRARNSATFSPQRVDEMVQSLGRDIAEAGAFGKSVPSEKVEALKAIRLDLRDALREIAPELESLDLGMSRLKPLAGAFGAASYPSGPKVGMGELGAFSGNRLSAGVAASRRPNILSAFARLENAASKLPGDLQPKGLTALLRLIEQTYMPTEASHSR
jgi:hypothetical protein